MGEFRTPEQIQADSELEAAINKTAIAYGFLGDSWVLGDFAVLAECQSFAPEEAKNTSYFILFPGGDALPWHRVWGLLRQHEIQLLAIQNREMHGE